MSRSDPGMRRVLFTFVRDADSVLRAPASAYRRARTFEEIPTEQVDQLALRSGVNRDARALSMSDATQADFVRSKGLGLAIAARYGGSPEALARSLDILAAVAEWQPFQRPGWSLGDPDRRMPPGGDGVNMATAWGINGVIDMMDALGDRVPADLRSRLRTRLRGEVEAIVDSWRNRRPWYVQSDAVMSNQWIDPSAALVRACLFLEDDSLAPAYQLGVENIWRSLQASAGDGAFLEGVTYAQMSLGPLFEAVSAMRGNGDLRCASHPFIRSSWKWLLHMLMPGGALVNCSDSHMSNLPAWAMTVPLDSMVMATLASGDPDAVAAMRKVFPEPAPSLAGLRLAAASMAPGTASLAPYAWFPSQQLVTWREAFRPPTDTRPEFALWVKGSSPGCRSHGHRDPGQLSVYYGGHAVLMDCGTPDYSDAALETQYAPVAGHGTMQVGGVQPRTEAVDAPLTVRRLDANGGSVDIDLTRGYRGVQQCTRSVTWSKGVVTIDDAVRFPASVPAGTEVYRFHVGSPGELRIRGGGTSWTLEWQGAAMKLVASVPIEVDQVAWPDRVQQPFTHPAVRLKLPSGGDALQVRCDLQVGLADQP